MKTSFLKDSILNGWIMIRSTEIIKYISSGKHRLFFILRKISVLYGGASRHRNSEIVLAFKCS